MMLSSPPNAASNHMSRLHLRKPHPCLNIARDLHRGGKSRESRAFRPPKHAPSILRYPLLPWANTYGSSLAQTLVKPPKLPFVCLDVHLLVFPKSSRTDAQAWSLWRSRRCQRKLQDCHFSRPSQKRGMADITHFGISNGHRWRRKRGAAIALGRMFLRV